MAILTLTEYKLLARITGTGDDTRLQKLLDMAHAAARRYCGRSPTDGFESATRTEIHDVDASQLTLKEWPITSITSITPILPDNTAGTALDSTTYHVDTATGVVSFNGYGNGRTFLDDDTGVESISDWSWQPNFGRCTVVYGSAAPADDIEFALFQMVNMMDGKGSAPSGITSQSLGQWSVTYASADQAAAAMSQILGPYRSGAGL